jgi:serine/threonine protein kinase/Tol biopolymer transport system component
MSTPERWQRVEALYHAALQRPAEERPQFLRDACGGDESMRRDVESLLAQPASDVGFLKTPALAVAARAVEASSTGAALVAGQALGPYMIVGLLGAGGMGEVYRASHGELEREVAIKLLPQAFVNDADRLARFEREKRLLAALNHPNIAAIYTVEPVGTGRALVLELVEGQTLAERLSRGPVPLGEALRIATQIADALEAAHEKGIVHRDLKPANIKLRPDGTVKVLDFGLAKAIANDGSTPDLTKSPTISLGGTGERVIGTPAYMSPEQASGLTVDRRTDIWAFGCVLFEMLTGHAPFRGETVTAILAAIIEQEPNFDALPAETPSAIRRLLRRCLEKHSKRRLRDIGDARLEIENIAREPADARMLSTRSTNTRRALVLASALVALGLSLVASVTVFFRRGRDEGQVTRLSVATPGVITAPMSVAISPDGRALAFVATDSLGRSMLWLRNLDKLEARALQGTDRATFPFWSPDGRFLGFSADGHLKRVDVTDGTIETLSDGASRVAGTWSPRGVILYGGANRFVTVGATGGGMVTTLSLAPPPGAVSGIVWPQFLPDGHHFLYFVQSLRDDSRGEYLGSIDAPETRRLLTSVSKAVFASPGYLLFVRDEALMAQRFDLSRFELTGKPMLVADGVWKAELAGQTALSASDNGVLAYVNAAVENRQWSWFDRAGRLLGQFGSPDRLYAPRLSPDGKRIAVARGPFGREDIWQMDLTGADASQLTFESQREFAPVWLADGKTIAYDAVRGPDQRYQLYQKDLDGSRTERVLLDTLEGAHIEDASRDGHFVVYSRRSGTRGGLWALSLGGDRESRVLVDISGVGHAQVSPNGHWIAYVTSELGREEVFIQSFPVPGGKRRVSVDGGVQPRWRRDGTELFYVASDQTLMAVSVKDGETLELGHPTTLFRTRMPFQGPTAGAGVVTYEVTPDGQRFLIPGPPAEAAPAISVVMNWTAALKQ